MLYLHYEYQKKNTFKVHRCHGLYLYFSGLSLRRASERLSYLIKRNHVSIWNWIQRYKPEKIASKRKKIEAYIIDETIIIKVGSNYIWSWIAIEPTKQEILGISISLERNMFVAEKFISKLCKIHGKHLPSQQRRWWYLVPTSL
jgi:putative transposase